MKPRPAGLHPGQLLLGRECQCQRTLIEAGVGERGQREPLAPDRLGRLQQLAHVRLRRDTRVLFFVRLSADLNRL